MESAFTVNLHHYPSRNSRMDTTSSDSRLAVSFGSCKLTQYFENFVESVVLLFCVDLLLAAGWLLLQ